ncbi:transposase, partial [Salmonella enterica subsp. enterica serovar Enteritidis]|nr:transposase [Salmonella enterica subsp. enterica serovar Enteritidis]
IKYRNNVIECDHGKLKRIINATLGFKSMKTAYATIKGALLQIVGGDKLIIPFC